MDSGLILSEELREDWGRVRGEGARERAHPGNATAPLQVATYLSVFQNASHTSMVMKST